ncbi:MAG: tandem-95 repeat protein [Bacteroidota bacterium]
MRTRNMNKLAFVYFLLLIGTTSAWAQCSCTFTIPAGTGIYTFDGAVKGAKPGDVVCLAPGQHERIVFQNVQGNPDNYIKIINCGGQALIGGPNANQAMSFARSKYYHLTGTGDPGVEYGIKVTESKASTQGIHNFDLSTDFEIDHVEIQNTGFAGIMAKSDPSKDCNNYIYERTNPTMTDIFVMRNLKIHHNYLHEIGGEGIYCGNSFYNGANVYCPARIQYPHEVRDVEIWDNIFESCAWESIQVGSGVQGILIHDNKISNYGAANVPAQNGGIQVGVGTSAKVYNNFIKKGSGMAIFVQGIGNIYVFNNVLINTGTYAILTSLVKTPLTTDIVPTGFVGPVYIMNNTIINPSANDAVVKESVPGPLGNMMFNNLVVGGQSNWLKLRGDTDWQKGNNVYIANMADAKFVNPALDDYRLAAGSPAINAGKDVSAQGITFDFDNKARGAGGAYDLGAFEFNGNQKPVVTTTEDTKIITLPTVVTTLTGAATDADGTIASLAWTKTSGPAATLLNTSLPTVNVSALVPGIYVFRLTATDNGGATGYKEVTVYVQDPTVNQPPVANGGGNKTVTLPTATAQCAGSGSDADGVVVQYTWTKISALTANMSGATTPTLNLSALVQGTHTFRLTVKDNKGATDFKDVQIFVNPAGVNQAPTANAGPDKTVNPPTATVNLSGTGSDSDGSIIGYTWVRISGPTATIVSPNSNNTVVNSLVVGVYVFRLTVTDNGLATAQDDVTVTVTTSNQAPKSNAGSDKTIQLPTSATTLPGSGSDADGTVSTYAWTRVSGPNTPTLANANTNTLSLSGLIIGTYVYRLTVTDNLGATDADDVSLIVQAANIAPVANPGATKNLILPVNSVTLVGSGTDADGSIATYLWEKVSGPAATTGATNASSLALSNLLEGTYIFKLTVTDNGGASGSNTVSVVVFPPTTNVAPAVSAGSDVTLTLPSNAVNLPGTATDSDGSIASYLWEKISGPAATLGGATTSTLALTNLVAGTYIFRFTATDDKAFSSSDEVQVKVTAANQNPIVNVGPTITVTLPTSTTDITAVASDPDGTIASYLWTLNTGPNAPTVLGNGTNHISISGLIAGNYLFRCTVTDNQGATGFDDVNVNVQVASNVNPVAEAGPAYNLFLPTNSVNLVGSGTDADGTIVSYAWTKIFGPAATLTNPNSATLTVADMIAGTYIFRLKVTDNDGGTAIDEATVVVNASSTNQAPIADAGPNIALSLPVNGTNLIGSGTDVDGSIASYLWFKVTGPPATMTNQNTAVLSIQDLTDGIYVFRLTVTDDKGAANSATTTVTVLPASVNQSPVVTAGNDITITLPNNALNLVAIASDADGSIASYAWTKQVGPTVTSSGQNSPTFALSDLIEGTYVFRITVADNDGAQASTDVRITVLAVGSNQPPIANAGSDKILFLPNSSVSLAGTATDDDGSIASYDWTKMSGPPATLANQNTSDLSVSGLVAGEYRFRLTVTDDDGLTAFDEVKVTVFPGTVNQSPVANAGSNKTIVLPTDDTSLAGSGFDPDGSIASYAWIQKAGPPVTIQGADSQTLSVTGLTAGVFQFQLTVTDDDGSIGSDVATVTVIAAGALEPPVADAGFDKVVKLPATTVDIQGNGFDSDGTIVTYLWAKKTGPGTVVLAGQNTATLSLSALEAGAYTFTLTVTDNDGLTNSDDMRVTVVPANVNSNPVVSAGLDVFIRQPATTASITATASDVDGTIATYQWTKTSGPAAILGGDNTATLSLSGLVLGNYTFRIEVTDNSGASSSDEVNLTLAPPGTNEPPVVLAGGSKTIGTPVVDVVLNGSASDNDGSIISVLWTQTDGPNTATLTDATSATLTITNVVEGAYTFRLTATDNENATAFSEANITIVDGSSLPQVFAGNDTTLYLPNNALELVGTASSKSGLITTYTWNQTEGVVQVPLTGEFPEVFLSDMLPGTYKFVLTAVDDKGNSGTDDIVVNVVEGKGNPLGAPIVFTPNGDLVNDVWVIRNTNMITGCPVAIFNSLGKKVYSASEYQNDWNGTFEGQSARDGDYYFVFDCSNQNKIYSGAFRIVR